MVFARYIFFVKLNGVTRRGYFCRFVAKTTFVGSIVYYTVEQGLWSKPEDSVHLYAKIYNNIAPYIKNNIPKEVLNEVDGFVLVKYLAHRFL